MKEIKFLAHKMTFHSFLRCAQSNCHATDKRDLLPSIAHYDVILFHLRSLTRADLPVKRCPQQRYTMFMMESASYLMGFDWYCLT